MEDVEKKIAELKKLILEHPENKSAYEQQIKRLEKQSQELLT